MQRTVEDYILVLIGGSMRRLRREGQPNMHEARSRRCLRAASRRDAVADGARSIGSVGTSAVESLNVPISSIRAPRGKRDRKYGTLLGILDDVEMDVRTLGKING
jgi:hypothetical protein